MKNRDYCVALHFLKKLEADLIDSVNKAEFEKKNAEEAARKKELWNNFEIGSVVKGTVRRLADFGAFVDIGVHQDGLVHISQICDKYIKHPSEVLSVGDVVKVKVLAVDVKKKRISLSMKL